MKNFIISILFFPLFVSCEKEPVEGEPLLQYHFINLTDETGRNLFESNQIPTSEFFYISGDRTLSWDDIRQDDEGWIQELNIEEFQQAADSIRKNNEYLILEVFQGDREKILSVKGERHTFIMAPLQEGFYLDGKPLKYSTDTIDKGLLYVHHVVLDEF